MNFCFYRLLWNQTTTHHKKLLFCNTCLQYTHKDNTMEKHKTECSRVVTIMPMPDKAVVEFKDHQRQMDVPWVVYVDIECVLQKLNSKVSSKTAYTMCFWVSN